MESVQSGFECEFEEKPPKAVQSECPVCLQVLREPYQATCCGYSFCRVCIDKINEREFPCPCCNAVGFNFFPNKGLQRSLYDFKVKCVNQVEGCQWVGELGQLEKHLNYAKFDKVNHLKGCQFAQTECPYCNELFKRSSIPAHVSDMCPKRPFSCEYCKNFDSNYEDVTTNHWSICNYYPLLCPNKCGEMLQRQNLENHIIIDCPLTVTNCDFQHVGCEARLPRQDMPAHLRGETATHVSLLAASHRLLTASHKKLKEENGQLRNLAAKLGQTLQILSSHNVPQSLVFIMNNFTKYKQGNHMWTSPPFYSHQCGYKMYLGVQANGVENCEGSHISAFIYIMRGEYDDILMWPYKGTLKITAIGKNQLMGRTLNCDNLCLQDRATEGGSSKRKCGFPQFLPHSLLEEYLRNDTLRFKISEINCISDFT